MNTAMFWIEIAISSALLIAGAIVGIFNYFSITKSPQYYERAGATLASGIMLIVAAFQDAVPNIAFALCAATFLATAIYAKKLVCFYDRRGAAIHAVIGAAMMFAVLVAYPNPGLPWWLAAALVIAGVLLVAPLFIAAYKEALAVAAGVTGLPSEGPATPEVAQSLAEATDTVPPANASPELAPAAAEERASAATAAVTA